MQSIWLKLSALYPVPFEWFDYREDQCLLTTEKRKFKDVVFCESFIAVMWNEGLSRRATVWLMILLND